MAFALASCAAPNQAFIFADQSREGKRFSVR